MENKDYDYKLDTNKIKYFVDIAKLRDSEELQKDIMFIDARPKEKFESGKIIENSVNLSPDMLY